MRDFTITRNEGELYEVKVVDTHGKKYKNWFEFAHECSEWIYYIWENEDNKVNEEELLHKAILNCKELDSKNFNLRLKMYLYDEVKLKGNKDDIEIVKTLDSLDKFVDFFKSLKL